MVERMKHRLTAPLRLPLRLPSRNPALTKGVLDMGFNLSSRRVILAGDSRAAGHSTRTCFATTGSAITYENAGPLNWAKFASRQKFDFVDIRDNFGVGGERTDQTLARLVTALDTGDFGAVVWLCSTNDRGSADYTFEQSKANLDAAVALVKARRRPMLIFDDFPRGNSVYPSVRLTGAQLLNHYRTSAYIREVLHDPKSGIFAIEGFGLLEDRAALNGDAIASVYHDGLHFNATGALRATPPLLAVLEMLWPDRDLLADYATNNRLTNPNFASETGGSGGSTWAGSLPAGWVGQGNGSASGALATWSLVTDANGDKWGKIVLSGTPTGVDGEISLRQDISTGLTVGALIDGGADIIVEAPVNLGSVSTRLIQQATVGGTTIMDARDVDLRDSASLLPSSLSIRGMTRLHEIPVTAGVANVRANMLSIRTGAAGVAVGGTIYFRRPKLVIL